MTELRPGPGFSWSATRHGLFQDCERAYFFQYYLSTSRAIAADPARVERAARLKHLTSIPLWVGSEVHDTVEQLLREATQQREPNVEQALVRMRERMRRAYKESFDDLVGRGADPRHHARFFEHEYAVEVAPEVWKLRVVEADEMIRSFTRLPFLTAARGLQRENLLGLENLEQWSIEGVPVWVKIDFAYRDPARRVRILDWKTGKHERGENPLQMVGYALYAEQRWGAALESLDVLEVYLRQDPPERPCALDRSVLERGLATIRSSIAAMLSRLSDPQQNRAEESNFELAADEWACRNCPFRAICPRWEGR